MPSTNLNFFKKFLILRELANRMQWSTVDTTETQDIYGSHRTHKYGAIYVDITASKHTRAYDCEPDSMTPRDSKSSYRLDIENRGGFVHAPKNLHATGLMARIAYMIMNQQATK